MSLTQLSSDESQFSPKPPILHQLPRLLLNYRIIIAVLKGDASAINILKHALNTSKEHNLPNSLLALRPTTPLSLNLPPAARILWATFTKNYNTTNSQRFTVVQPNHLTDHNLKLEKLSKTTNRHIPLIIGDFIDNVLPVSTVPAGIYSFSSRLFTRIRTNEQTARHRRHAWLKENSHIEEICRPHHRVQLSRKYGLTQNPSTVLDHLQNQYGHWNNNGTPKPTIDRYHIYQQRTFRFGRRYDLPVEDPALPY